jgi:hypothetical protein
MNPPRLPSVGLLEEDDSPFGLELLIDKDCNRQSNAKLMKARDLRWSTLALLRHRLLRSFGLLIRLLSLLSSLPLGFSLSNLLLLSSFPISFCRCCRCPSTTGLFLFLPLLFCTLLLGLLMSYSRYLCPLFGCSLFFIFSVSFIFGLIVHKRSSSLM